MKKRPLILILLALALLPIVSRGFDLTRDRDVWAFTSQDATDAKAAYDQSLYAARKTYDDAIAAALKTFEAATIKVSNEQALKKAREQRTEAVAKARATYQKEKLAAREQLVAYLTGALKAAAAANDLDEALRIRAARDRTEAGWPIPIEAEAAWSYEARVAEAIENALGAAASANAQRFNVLAQAQSTLAESIDAILTDATQAGDLDDAKRIRNTKPHLLAVAAENALGLAKTDGPMELPLITCDFATCLKMLRFDVIDCRQLIVIQEYKGRRNVLMTHPKAVEMPCRLLGRLSLPPDRKIRLVFSVVNNVTDDWRLMVKVNGRTLKDTIIGPAATGNDWTDFEFDLSEYAGTRISLELIHIANNWQGEFGYWDNVKLIYE